MKQSSKKPHVFGAVVIRARQRKGPEWTRYRLALVMGKNQNWLYRVEHGKSEPKITTIIEIAEALEMEPKELFHELYLALKEQEKQEQQR